MINKSLLKFDDWFLNYACPIWLENAFIDEKIELLDFNAKAIKIEKTRIRVILRKIYFLAYLLNFDKNYSYLLDDTLKLVNFAMKFCQNNNNLYLEYINENNEKSGECLLYNNAFAIIAFNEFCKYLRKIKHKEYDYFFNYLTKLQKHTKSNFISLNNDFYYPYANKSEHILQNPIMHYFEASIETDIDNCDFIIDILRNYFLYNDYIFESTNLERENLHSERENYQNEINIEAEVQVGHHYEWYSLLHFYGKNKKLQDAIFNSCEKLDKDRSYPALSQYMNSDNINEKTRIWVLLEKIRAYLIKNNIETKTKYEEIIIQNFDLLFDYNLATDIKGLWYDETAYKGKSTETNVSASTLYHFVTLHKYVRSKLEFMP